MKTIVVFLGELLAAHTTVNDVMKGAGVEAIHTPLQVSNANAFAERWVRSLRQECSQLSMFSCGPHAYK